MIPEKKDLEELREVFKFYYWKWTILRDYSAKVKLDVIALEINNLRKGVVV